MMKRMLAGLLALALMLGGAAAASVDVSQFVGVDGEQRLTLLGMDFFSKTIDELEASLLQIGYQESAANQMGKALGIFCAYESSTLQPRQFSFNFAAERMPTRVSVTFAADAQAYGQLSAALTALLGPSSVEPAYSETQGNLVVEYNEAEHWSGSGATVRIFCTGGSARNTLNDIRQGGSDFVLQVSPGESSPATPVPAAATPAPTATPKPMKLDVSIFTVEGKRNSIGNTELYVRFKNRHASKTIDRIDFSVKCYDAYGAHIRGYGLYDYTDCYYDDAKLPSGKTTPSNHYWTLYGFDGTRKVEIAITKYHFTDGTTVTVPPERQEWKTYSF